MNSTLRKDSFQIVEIAFALVEEGMSIAQQKITSVVSRKQLELFSFS